MSQLESDVKPILIRLIADPQQLAALSTEEQIVVARWTVKTAAIFNRASTHGDLSDKNARPVPDEHLRLIASGKIPNDIVIVGGGYGSQKPFDWLQFSTWASPKNSIPLKEQDRNRSYKIALAFRGLILAVAYYPSSEYRYAAVESHYVPLWTGKRGLLLLPFEHLVDTSLPKSNSPEIERFLRNIFVISDTMLTLVENCINNSSDRLMVVSDYSSCYDLFRR